MKIGIIGLGVVGSAVEYGMKSLGHHVKVHDIKLKTKITDVLDTEICYICVPTPIGSKGHCDISIVEQVIGDLCNLDYTGIIAINFPMRPVIKNMGAKARKVVRIVVKTGLKTSAVPSTAASTGVFFSSEKWRYIFSATIIASSTMIPTTIIMAVKDTVSRAILIDCK